MRDDSRMDQRISLITLGVADLRRAMDFYAALGWEGRSPDDDVAFYQAGGMAFALWSRAKLAHNVRSPAEVDAVLAEARAAGGTVPRPGGGTFWGGYSGVFHDPDGHAW